MAKYTLVPSSFFRKEDSYKLLSQAVQLDGNDEAKYQELPEFQAVLVYASNSGQGKPVIADLLAVLPSIDEHNKVVAHFDGSELDIAIAEGSKLLFANTYEVSDHVSGEYFIFAAMRQFQMNPEVTVVYFYGDAPFKMKNDLIRFCKGVERI